MDAKLKAEWVKALRSGEYQQAHETLYDGAGYCCLGVLCKVIGFDIWEDGGGVGKGCGMRSSFSSYEPIFELVGGYEASHKLSMRNDGLLEPERRKWSFHEIADYIEASVPDDTPAALTSPESNSP